MQADTPARDPVDVLIAEDDALIRKSLRSLLEQAGYRCAEAENGPEAVELARRHPPRCVFLELVMSGRDSCAIARQLRADAGARDIHIHCLAGPTDRLTRERAGQAGFEAFLPKPIDPAGVLDLVRAQGPRGAGGWVCGLTKSEAEDVLDALENHGRRRSEVACPDGSEFAVRFDPPHLRPAEGRRPLGPTPG